MNKNEKNDIFIKAEVRSAFGTSESRRLRRNNFVTGSILNTQSQAKKFISLDSTVLKNLVNFKNFLGKKLFIEVDNQSIPCSVSDYSAHPVTRALLNLDLIQLIPNTVSEFRVPVVFINYFNSIPGKQGEVLNLLKRSLTIRCLSEDYIEKIVIDLKNASFGDKFRVSDLVLPEGVKVVCRTPNVLIASLLGKKSSLLKSASSDAEATSAA